MSNRCRIDVESMSNRCRIDPSGGEGKADSRVGSGGSVPNKALTRIVNIRVILGIQRSHCGKKTPKKPAETAREERKVNGGH